MRCDDIDSTILRQFNNKLEIFVIFSYDKKEKLYLHFKRLPLL